MLQPWLTIIAKLMTAVVLGGVIGLERELGRKAAGLRTNATICMGATLYMIISRHISGGAPYTDPARLAAQVVAGIGFLGAGVILQAKGAVHGLTTAATIFVVGGIGIAVGEGMFGLAVLTTGLIVVVLVLLRWLERIIVQRRCTFHYSLRTTDPAELTDRLLDLLRAERVPFEDFDIRDVEGGAHEVRVSVITSIEGNQRLLKELPQLGTNFKSSGHRQVE